MIAGENTQRSAKLPRTDNIALFFDLLAALLSTPRTLPAVKAIYAFCSGSTFGEQTMAVNDGGSEVHQLAVIDA